MIVKINGVEEPYAVNTIDIDDAIGQRSTASFTIVDRTGNKRFKRGQNVEISEKVDTGGDPATWDNDNLSMNWEG